MNNLKKLRNEKKLSIANFADLTGISERTIHNLEFEKTKPRLSTIEILCDFFNVSKNEIFPEA